MEPAPPTEPRPGSDRRSDRRLTIALWAALAVAVIVRVAFLADKPFWRDEAWVALLVADPLRAVSDGRAVPLGFLLMTRLAAALPLASPEVSYRLVPLLCGVAVVPLLARLALALGQSRRTAVAAAWLAVGLQPLVYYSRELKSYDIDLLLAVLLPLLALRGFQASTSRPAARWGFLACVVAAPWVSYGGIFPVCAVLAWGWLAWWRDGSPEVRRAWMRCTVAFVVSFVVVYLVALGPQANSPRLQAYWHHSLSSDARYWLPQQFLVACWKFASISATYLFRGLWPAVLLVAAVGACTWPRPQRGFLLFYYAATASFCAAAAVTDHYLLVNGRHLLCAAPIPLLWAAGGLGSIGRRLGPRLGGAFVLAIPVVLSLAWSAQAIRLRLGPYHTNASHFFRFDVLHDADTLIGLAGQHIRNDEPLLVSRKCAYAYQFYNRGRIADATYCERYCANFRSIARKWLDGVRSRAWVMITDEEKDSFGRFLDEEGFGHRLRASASGMRLWEIERKGTGRARDTQRTTTPGSESGKRSPPPTTWPE